MLALCEETRCRRQALLAYFDEELPNPCGHCDNCVDGVQTWNATEPARQALSAIYRSGQRYGVGHLVDILLGRDNDKVRGLGHQHLSVFGMGKALAEAEWRSLFRQLVARGLADVDLDGFGGLRLSDSCRPLLRGEVNLELRRDLTSKAPKPAASAASQLVRSEERETWEALRTLRRKLAEEHGVPPYVIFPDATLLEMLRSQPASLSDMATISGVGARKLERYGQAFLEVLQGSVEVAKSPADLRHELITLARAGMTPAQIARQLDCSEKNVYAMLAEAIGLQQLSLEQALDLPEDLLGEIQEAFLDGEGELPPVGAVAEQFAERSDGWAGTRTGALLRACRTAGRVRIVTRCILQLGLKLLRQRVSAGLQRPPCHHYDFCRSIRDRRSSCLLSGAVVSSLIISFCRNGRTCTPSNIALPCNWRNFLVAGALNWIDAWLISDSRRHAGWCCCTWPVSITNPPSASWPKALPLKGRRWPACSIVSKRRGWCIARRLQRMFTGASGSLCRDRRGGSAQVPAGACTDPGQSRPALIQAGHAGLKAAPKIHVQRLFVLVIEAVAEVQWPQWRVVAEKDARGVDIAAVEGIVGIPGATALQ